MRACFLVCSPSQRGAIQLVARANRHVRATALYGDGFITGLRFDSFAFVRAGAMDADGARAGPAPRVVEDRAGVLMVVGKGRAALLHAWT